MIKKTDNLLFYLDIIKTFIDDSHNNLLSMFYKWLKDPSSINNDDFYKVYYLLVASSGDLESLIKRIEQGKI